MVLYGLKTCDTCRKALKNLKEARFVDVRSEGVPQDVMSAAFNQYGQALLNTRSTTWRGLTEAERARPPLDLLFEHPTLMKRPLVVSEGRIFLGWTAEVQDLLGVG